MNNEYEWYHSERTYKKTLKTLTLFQEEKKVKIASQEFARILNFKNRDTLYKTSKHSIKIGNYEEKPS